MQPFPPLPAHCFSPKIYPLIGSLKDLGGLKFNRAVFLNTFNDLSEELAKIACSPMLVKDYVVLLHEYVRVEEGHCPLTENSVIKRVRELLFHGITAHPKFKHLSLKEIVCILKSETIPEQFLNCFVKHPSVVNITKYKHRKIQKAAEKNEESAFLKIWFGCMPESKKYIPSEEHEREHVESVRKMRRDASDLTSGDRTKAGLYLAIQNNRCSTAEFHISKTSLSFNDAVYYLFEAIQTGKLEMVKSVLKESIEPSEYPKIAAEFKILKKNVDIESDRSYEKLVLQVFAQKDFPLLSILLSYESIFFEDNIAEQLLADMIDDSIGEQDYDKIKSFHEFTDFDVNSLIKDTARSHLFKWISKHKTEKVLTLLKHFPFCSETVLKIAPAQANKEDFLTYIHGLHELNVPVDTYPLLNYACKGESLGNVQLALKYGASSPKSEDDRLRLLKKVIKNSTVEILEFLQNHLEINLKEYMVRKHHIDWNIDSLLEILFKGCHNCLPMMEYFRDLLITHHLDKKELIESYIMNAAPKNFHGKVYLIALTCSNEKEKAGFMALAMKDYKSVSRELWGSLSYNDYLSDSDKATISKIHKEIFNKEEVPHKKTSLAWKTKGAAPFDPTYTPFDLDRQTEQELLKFGNDIVGIILPYSGLDTGPTPIREGDKYLHLYNFGQSFQVATGIVEEVKFEYVGVFPKKRTVLQLR